MKRTKATLITVFAMVSGRAADITTTFHFSPGLEKEGNPLQHYWKVGADNLLLINLILTLILTASLLVYWKSKTFSPLEKSQSIWDFASLLLFNEKYGKMKFLTKILLITIPKPRQFSYLAFCLAWAVTFTSFAAVFSWFAIEEFHLHSYVALRNATSWGYLLGPELAAGLLGFTLAAIYFFKSEYKLSLETTS